jgi:hypothetical protein
VRACVLSLSSRLLLFYAYGLGIGKRSTVATKVIERIEAHYEVQDVEMGKVYRWCPESVVVECECGKKLSLTASKNAYGDCGIIGRSSKKCCKPFIRTTRRKRLSSTPGVHCALTTHPPGGLR